MTRLLLAAVFAFICLCVNAQNNTCATPTSLSQNSVCSNTASSLQNATSDGPAITSGCGSGTPNDVWFTFQAQSSSVAVSLSGLGSNLTAASTYIQIFSGTCGSFTSEACGAASASLTANTLVPGTTYYIRVYVTGVTNTGGAASRNFNICVTGPINDVCSNAVNIAPVASCGAIANQSLYLATNGGSPTNPQGTTNDVWYRFTTPANVRAVQIAVSGAGSALTTATTFIEAFNASSCGSITTLNSLATVPRNNTLTLNGLTPSTQYYFRVFTTNTPATTPANNWNFSICVSYTTPSNNECSNAIPLTTGTTNTSINILNATASSGIPAPCTGTPDDDIWYSFSATRTFATVAVSGGHGFTFAKSMVQVFSGTCGTLTQIGCGQDAVNLTGLTVGTVYYIRVFTADVLTPTSYVGNPFAVNIAVLPGDNSTVVAGRMNEVFRQDVISTSSILADPWEITYGPDNNLWVTESKGYKVFRINPTTGARTTVLDLSPGSTFFSSPADTFNAQFNINVNGAQGGMAGLALHPKFLDPVAPQNFAYVSYIHRYNGGGGTLFTNKLVRFTYNTGTGKFESPVSLCDTLPGSNDHNSQRVIVAPLTAGGTDYFVFYASGDMGAAQFANQNRPLKSQQTNSYEGKILRFNPVPDGQPGSDGWIPDDNPYNNIAPVIGQSAVWATGIRNNQGFAYDSVLNILYGSSHGPYSDDEINIIERDKNYGHPLVIGYAADDNYNNCTAGTTNATSSAPLIVDESNNAAVIPNYKDPLFSAYASSPAIPNIFTNIWSLTNPPNNGTWPSEGWSGLDLYTHTLIPAWKKSLIASSLKWGRLVKLRLNSTGTATAPTNTAADTISYFGSTNRFRDIAIAPNGRDLYVIMDRSSTTSGPSAGNPIVPACGGCVQKYTFLGYNDNAGTSTIPASIPIDSSTNAGCVTGTTVTINAANNNNNLWVPITGPNGNIIAEINANGNDLNAVNTSFFTRTGAPVRSSYAKYLNRNVTINVPAPTNSVPFATPVSVRLYITAKELADIIASTGSGVTNIATLGVFKNNDACGNKILTLPTGQTVTGRYTQSTFGHAIQLNVTSFSSFYFASTATTLPFDLITFTGKAVNDASKLEWVVANQREVLAYTVERSLDGVKFDEIATVQPKSGTGDITYNFTDFNAASLGTVIYYRIRSNELNGSSKYTNIINVNFAPVLITSLSLFPNPVTEKTNVLINAIADETVQLKVIDNTGRIIHVMNVNLVKGKNNVQLDVSKFKTGLYYIDVTGKAINEKAKLIKQ